MFWFGFIEQFKILSVAWSPFLLKSPQKRKMEVKESGSHKNIFVVSVMIRCVLFDTYLCYYLYHLLSFMHTALLCKNLCNSTFPCDLTVAWTACGTPLNPHLCCLQADWLSFFFLCTLWHLWKEIIMPQRIKIETRFMQWIVQKCLRNDFFFVLLSISDLAYSCMCNKFINIYKSVLHCTVLLKL